MESTVNLYMTLNRVVADHLKPGIYARQICFTKNITVPFTPCVPINITAENESYLIENLAYDSNTNTFVSFLGSTDIKVIGPETEKQFEYLVQQYQTFGWDINSDENVDVIGKDIEIF